MSVSGARQDGRPVTPPSLPPDDPQIGMIGTDLSRRPTDH